MAEWKETLEPYIRVTERVRTAANNPTAGEDLIIGVALISDAGPTTPTLVTSQADFISTFGSGELSKAGVESLNGLYTGDNKELPAVMWQNAYRLAGSNNLLVCRASKSAGINFAKALVAGDTNTYILRDGELLKKVPNVKFVLDTDLDDAEHDKDGWSLNINGVGIYGNRTTDKGPQYDYFTKDLPDLVNLLNDTSKFYSPSYSFFADDRATKPLGEDEGSNIKSVVFNELYLGVDLLDTSDSRCPGGNQFLIICEPDWTTANPDQKVIDINSTAWSGFTPSEFSAANVYNSKGELKLRIRRFNHDAVLSKTISTGSLTEKGESPWSVINSVLDTYTANGTKEPSSTVLARDFFEIAVLDPNTSETVLFFNVGNIPGRGDMTVDEVNDSLSSIQLNLPDDLHELGLAYYGYAAGSWEEIDGDEVVTHSVSVNSLEELPKSAGLWTIAKVGTGLSAKYYQLMAVEGEQVFVDLSVNPAETRLLDVSDTELKKAIDNIGRDEVYTVEGLCDLGNTDPSFQNYLATMAVNENYFYPASTNKSTNYLSIANTASKLTVDSYKVYLSAPWDIDSGTLGWRCYMSPSVLYWEAVGRNRRNNSEFAPVFGQSTGVVQYQRPMVEFNKKTRQLLLSKRVNTALWNNSTTAWNMNDNYTKQSVDSIMSDEGNARLSVRISRAMPTLLRQFIGWKVGQRLWDSATSTIDYWFKSVILSMNYSIDDYRIVIDSSNNSEEVQRQNKMQVQILVRYQRSLKYVVVYHDILDVGMDVSVG